MSQVQESSAVSFLKRPETVMALGSIMFATFAIDYYVTIPGVTDLIPVFESWSTIIGYFAYLLGTVSMFRRGIRQITARRGEWWVNAAQMGVVTAMAAGFLISGASNPVFLFFNNNIKSMGFASTFALHGFLTFSASFRAIRFKNLQTTVAAILMIIIMLFQVPLGNVIWPGIGVIGQWLTDYVLTAGTRGIMVTSAIGMFILGIRLLLWRERGMYGFRAARKKE